MSLKMSWGLTAVLTLCELAVSSMVLPRPPSSPNSSSREAGTKLHNEKPPIYSLVQLNTNVEKPNTDGYRLLEIELAGASDMDEENLRGLVRAMLSNEETESEIEHEAENQREENDDEENEEDQHRHPEVDLKESEGLLDSRPEVIPSSSLGMRAIDGESPSSSYRRSEAEPNEEKRTLLRPPPEVEDSRSPSSNGGYPSNVRIETRGKTGSYGKSPKYTRPKKYTGTRIGPETVGDRAHGRTEDDPATPSTWRLPPMSRENRYRAITSTELPKQIPTPPSRFLSLVKLARTTPVQKYTLRRTPDA